MYNTNLYLYLYPSIWSYLYLLYGIAIDLIEQKVDFSTLAVLRSLSQPRCVVVKLLSMPVCYS